MCLNRLKVLDPCFSTVSRTIRSPRKTIRMDIVIADPEQRWIVCARAKLLFNMHFRAFPLTGTQVLQPGSFLSRHQLPLLLSRIVCTESSGHVECLEGNATLVANGERRPLHQRRLELRISSGARWQAT